MVRKWNLVRSFRIALHTAIPTAPPRLRIMLNSPLAYLSRSGDRLPSPRFAAGATTKTCAPRLRLSRLRAAIRAAGATPRALVSNSGPYDGAGHALPPLDLLHLES